MEKDNHFVLGFIAGEGSFLVSMTKKEANNTGFDLSPSFRMGVHERDKPLLEEVSEVLPVECRIYESGNECQLYVGSMDRLLRLVEWIREQDSMLKYSEKWESLDTFEEILTLMKEGKHNKPEGLVKVAELRDKMNNGGHCNRRTADDIRDEVTRL